MAIPCPICNHPQRQAIDKALLATESLQHVTSLFNVPYRSLFNHKKNHVTAKLKKAKEVSEGAEADSLLKRIKSLETKALSLLDKAESSGDLRTALHGVREARACLEILAKLQGELAQEGATTVNVLVTSPAWVEMRTVIITALEDYPEAKAKLTEALEANYAGS